MLLSCVYFPEHDAGITPKELKRICLVMLLLLAGSLFFRRNFS